MNKQMREVLDMEVAISSTLDWLRRIEEAGQRAHKEGVKNDAISRAVLKSEEARMELHSLLGTLKELRKEKVPA